MGHLVGLNPADQQQVATLREQQPPHPILNCSTQMSRHHY